MNHIIILLIQYILFVLRSFWFRIIFFLVLILLKPSKSDIFCDDYCQESTQLSDNPINKCIYFFKFQYTLILVGIELYSKVGRCLPSDVFHLTSLIVHTHLKVSSNNSYKVHIIRSNFKK